MRFHWPEPFSPTSFKGLVRRLSELHISTRAKPRAQAGLSFTSPLSTFTSLPSLSVYISTPHPRWHPGPDHALPRVTVYSPSS